MDGPQMCGLDPNDLPAGPCPGSPAGFYSFSSEQCSYMPLFPDFPVQVGQNLLHIPVDIATWSTLSSGNSSLSPVTPGDQPMQAVDPKLLGLALDMGQPWLYPLTGPFEQQFNATLSPGNGQHSQPDQHPYAVPCWEGSPRGLDTQQGTGDEWLPDLIDSSYTTAPPPRSDAVLRKSMVRDSQPPPTLTPSTSQDKGPSSHKKAVKTTQNRTSRQLSPVTSPRSRTIRPRNGGRKRNDTAAAAITTVAHHQHPPTVTPPSEIPRSPSPPGEVPATSEVQRARNRLATSKCRAKAKTARGRLERDSRAATRRREEQVTLVAQLRNEVLDLKSEVLRHVDCDCRFITQYMHNAARKLGEGLPGPVEMPELPYIKQEDNDEDEAMKGNIAEDI